MIARRSLAADGRPSAESRFSRGTLASMLPPHGRPYHAAAQCSIRLMIFKRTNHAAHGAKRPVVLLAAEGLEPKASGIGRVARLMAKVLTEQAQLGRLELRALTLSDPGDDNDFGLAARSCRGSQLRFLLENMRAARDCSHFIYDAVSVARAHPHWLPPRRPDLVWIHGVEVWESPRPTHLRVVERASCIVSNSALTRDRAAARHPHSGRARVCWLATETDDASQRVPTADAAQQVLLLGRIDEHGGRKGHRELIACWPDVVAAVPRARLLLAGGGPGEPAVRRMVERSSVRQSIELLGFVPEAELPALWTRANVLAMPSTGEGFGLSYIEAMRHGMAVVGSVHDAAIEVNVDGVTGFNVDRTQPGALSEALIKLLRDPTLTARMGAAGQARWREHYCYSAFRARFLPILDAFLGLTPGFERAGK
jgi:phosphatidyl-myo-inositol dimannoside synthase